MYVGGSYINAKSLTDAMGFGFLLVSADDNHFSTAIRTADQIKEVMPETPIAIATDAERVPEVFDTKIGLEDPNYGWGDKVYALKKTPFEKTVYLDNDVYLSDSISELSKILDQFEIAASYGIGREPFESDNEVPVAFPEVNTGVIAYRDTESVQDLFSEWEQIYEEDVAKGIDADQPAFRKAIYRRSIEFLVLPREYNIRTPYLGFLNGTGKIIHGWHERPIEDIATTINSTTSRRVHVTLGDEPGVFAPSNTSPLEWVWFTLATHGTLKGLMKSIKLGYREISETIVEK